jgi:murein DD-endopeptidase MepM/ murein hydrolase activator NlpD
MMKFTNPTNGHIRQSDKFGSGQFNASRDGGKRHHNGLDFIARSGEPVKSPISGYFERFSFPYKDDLRFHGVVIRGSGVFQELEVKIFYVTGLCFGSVEAGDIIGYAQDITTRYNGITNHVHMEVRKNGHIVSPNDYFDACF